MIEPTPENVALYILANGFCTKCGAKRANIDKVIRDGFYCPECWLPMYPLGNESQEFQEWSYTLTVWQRALQGELKPNV